jgi:drug/metabolite transporter (DMT)-like permease
MKQNLFRVYAALVLAMIFWSFSFIWYKQVYEFYEPITVVFFRLVISSFFLFGILYFTKGLMKVHRGDFKYFILLSFFEPFLYFLGESFGVKLVSSTIAAVMVSIIPIFSGLVAVYIFKEKFSLINTTGVIIAIFGVGLVLFNPGFELIASPLGLSLMMLAVVSAVFYSIMIRKLTSNYGVIQIVAVENMIGAFMFAPLFFIFDLRGVLETGIPLGAVSPLLKLAIFASSFAFVFFTYGIKHLGMAKANIFSYAIPVFTAILAWYILGDEITLRKITGILIVFAGLTISQVKRFPKKIKIFQRIIQRY